MDINLVWDQSVADAPEGFKAAVEAAADDLDRLLTNAITVNIEVGWGEDNGQPLGGALAEGGPFIDEGLTYTQVRDQLAANAHSAAAKTAVAHLSAADPTHGGTFYITGAQEKAWGLLPAGGAEIDGAVGFSTSADWDTNPNDRAVAGKFDLVGSAEHELTHALGRMSGLGEVFGAGNYTVLDLFRYAAPGSHELTGGQPAYFSINGGTTDLAPFDTRDDYADWAASPGPDSFDAVVGAGVENPLTRVDVTEMSALGFDVAPCFLRGSRVLTTAGERAVERLAVGDSLVTASGRIAPIVWIGERRIDCRGHPAVENVWPVRIHAGAFEPGKPAQDLLLSPDHAVFAEGVLVAVKHLVNGSTIVQEAAAHVHYLHIELDRHDILLAQGLEVESYLDSGNRAQFANGGVCAIGHAARPRAAGHGACAPLATDGAAVIAVRRRLLDRASRCGHRMAERSELVVSAAGKSIAPAVTGEWRRFVLPPGAGEVRIHSGSGVPAWMDPGSDDRRRLGASIGAIALDQVPIPLDSPALAGGFHAIEDDGSVRWRWTDGAATLRLSAADRPRVLDLLVHDIMRGWAGAPPDAIALAA